MNQEPWIKRFDKFDDARDFRFAHRGRSRKISGLIGRWRPVVRGVIAIEVDSASVDSRARFVTVDIQAGNDDPRCKCRGLGPGEQRSQRVLGQSNTFWLVAVDAAKQQDRTFACKFCQRFRRVESDRSAKRCFFPTLKVISCGQKVLRCLSRLCWEFLPKSSLPRPISPSTENRDWLRFWAYLQSP